MPVEVGVIRGGSKKEVFGKKHNIYVGISLGNKWFTKNNLREHLHWALQYSKDKVGLLIGDTLHAINYEERNGLSPEKARRKAIRSGDKMVVLLKELILELPSVERKKIMIIRWDEVLADPPLIRLAPVVDRLFVENKNFREDILNMVRSYTEAHEKRYSDEQILGMCRYILNELPEMILGFHINAVYYNCQTYPVDSALMQFVEKIQEGKYPELSLKTEEKNIFVELRVV